MIDDMASLKQAMEQMDADDVTVAEAAKDRAAQILSDAKLSFSKMAELIEQRRLLLRPKIVTSIKRMDQPDTLGDAAFRDTGASLRREGQSFRQIAEALELNGGTAPRYEETVHKGVVLHQMEMESEPDGPDWPRTPTLAMRIAVYPFRHPIRFLTIALLAVMLFNSLHDFAGFGRRISGYVGDVSAARERADAAMSSVSSFVEKRIMRPSQEAAGPPTLPPPPRLLRPPIRRRPQLRRPVPPSRPLPSQPRPILPQMNRHLQHLHRRQPPQRPKRHVSTRGAPLLQTRQRKIVVKPCTRARSTTSCQQGSAAIPGWQGHVSVASAVATGAVVNIDLPARPIPKMIV